MNIYFYLRQQSKITDPTIILQVFDARFKGRKFMFSTGFNLSKEDWKKDRGVKGLRGMPRGKTEHLELITHLDNLKTITSDWLKDRYNSITLNREDLKKHLTNSLKDERKEKEDALQNEVEFFALWRTMIDNGKNPKSGLPIAPNTRKTKLQTLSLMQQYSLDCKFTPTLLNIDLNFYSAFDNYMRGRKLAANSRGKHFKEIKTFLREASEHDYEVNPAYLKKGFKVIKKETDAVYLSLTDIEKLLTLILSPPLERVRDIFCAACFVGARHSDWRQICVDNIDKLNGESVLLIRQQKTSETIHVPLHPKVRVILDKYNGRLPRVISGQKINAALKEICAKAELGTASLNGKIINKAECISTHTARRSFATNTYLHGMRAHEIMMMTGHKTESSFLAYLKLGGKDHAVIAAKNSFFTEEHATMKVA